MEERTIKTKMQLIDGDEYVEGIEKDMEKVFYLCDGRVPECSKSNCYLVNNGPCKRTTDIKHAINFVKMGKKSVSYHELERYSKIMEVGAVSSRNKQPKLVRQREVRGMTLEISVPEETVLPNKQRVKTAQEIKRLSEKIVTVIASENVTINVAECALDEAKKIMRTHTIANFTCQ